MLLVIAKYIPFAILYIGCRDTLTTRQMSAVKTRADTNGRQCGPSLSAHVFRLLPAACTKERPGP